MSWKFRPRTYFDLNKLFAVADKKGASEGEDGAEAEDGRDRGLVRDFLARIRPQMSRFLKSSSQPAVQVSPKNESVVLQQFMCIISLSF